MPMWNPCNFFYLPSITKILRLCERTLRPNVNQQTRMRLAISKKSIGNFERHVCAARIHRSCLPLGVVAEVFLLHCLSDAATCPKKSWERTEEILCCNLATQSRRRPQNHKSTPGPLERGVRCPCLQLRIHLCLFLRISCGHSLFEIVLGIQEATHQGCVDQERVQTLTV